LPLVVVFEVDAADVTELVVPGAGERAVAGFVATVLRAVDAAAVTG
jgi:hypothetical protein